MWNSEGFYEKLLDGWERSETSTGVPYYVNHGTARTQWDHPFLVKTLEELSDFDSIRYAAYRTAMKLRFIQKRLRLDLVDLNTLRLTCDRHGLQTGIDSVVDCSTLYALLLDIYSITRRDKPQNLNTDTLAELTLNWLLNLFDVNKEGCIRVLSVKIGLAVLCSARLNEKYRFFFNNLCDKSNHLSRRKLGLFLYDILQLPEVINESMAFGGLNISPAVESCFRGAWHTNGCSEDVFLEWLLKEPQTLVWLPTLHRMAASESVKHEAKCSVCKDYPIIGFRYRCLKCFNYDICQQCFFTGRVSKNHKLKHPSQEYCLTTTSKDDTKAFIKTIRNNLSKKHCNKKKLRYLPIYGTEQPYTPNEL